MSTETSPVGLPPDDALLDVVVVGGGIVGAGVAREAATRGLSVALVEQNDFASGTSSRSSRLLHGGLRYLGQGRVGLVREASREKKILQRIAPHLVQPLAFVFPTRKGSPWPRWKLALGVKVYDLLAGGNFAPSQVLSVEEVTGLVAPLQANDLTGAVRYFDALTNDARLVIDTIRSASRAGAFVANYTRLEEATRSGDFWRCTLRESATGQLHKIRAAAVVNAAGPWADRFPQSRVKLRLTKGVHLVVDRARLAIPDAVVMLKGDRILFAIPWGERVILGTTDTDYDGPLDAPTCELEDTRYVLDVANAAFPAAKLSEEDVISAWAGLRPLIAEGEAGGPSDISRRHEITQTEPGWFDVAGGKLTTYRLMAEQTIDRVARRVTTRTEPSRTASEPLLPARLTSDVSQITPPPVSRELVEHFCQHEWARHLDDVLVRRTGWVHYHRDRAELAEKVVRWMGELLDWTAETRDAERGRA
jgi:glycerol-3-phosphate dehydrogenase